MIGSTHDPLAQVHPPTGRRAPPRRPPRTGRAPSGAGREARLAERRGSSARAAGSARGSARGHTDGDRRQLPVAPGTDAPRRRAPRPPPGALRRRQHQGAPLDAGDIMIALVLLVLLGLAGCASPAAAPPPTGASVPPPRAGLSRGQKRGSEPEAELEKVIALNPRSPDGYLTLARHFVEQRAHDKARGVLLRLVTVSPNLAQAHLLPGRP